MKILFDTFFNEILITYNLNYIYKLSEMNF